MEKRELQMIKAKELALAVATDYYTNDGREDFEKFSARIVDGARKIEGELLFYIQQPIPEEKIHKSTEVFTVW